MQNNPTVTDSECYRAINLTVTVKTTIKGRLRRNVGKFFFWLFSLCMGSKNIKFVEPKPEDEQPLYQEQIKPKTNPEKTQQVLH